MKSNPKVVVNALCSEEISFSHFNLGRLRFYCFGKIREKAYNAHPVI
jgi:hypothetical protein